MTLQTQTELSKAELKILLETRAGPCLSLFLPTYQAGSEVLQNPIRWRNLVRQAEQQLLALNLRRPVVQHLLEPAQALGAQAAFWQHQAKGLAVFLAPEVELAYALPFPVTDAVVVADHFSIKPVLPAFTLEGQFYVLALSQNAVRLFHGTHQQLQEVALLNTPQNLAEALQYDVPQKELQFHTSTQTPGGTGRRRPAVYFSQGMVGEGAQTDLLRYFQQVAAGVRQTLGQTHLPLLLASVDYLQPLYAQVNAYPHLLEKGILGNPEHLNLKDLHAKAWALVAPHLQQAQRGAEERYAQLSGSGSRLATTDLKRIVSAAAFGEVHALFVAQDQQQWGRFFPADNRAEIHATAAAGDEDLLDVAAGYTLLNNGAVYAVAADRMPAPVAAAAILRY